MRLVVVGATGNVGTSLLEVAAADPEIDSILGIARRLPRDEFAKTTWVRTDITKDDLVPHFRGGEAVSTRRIRNGKLTPPNGPGIGVEPAPDLAERYPYRVPPPLTSAPALYQGSV
jgi:L-alanine-DL-glutamate epimerase-like enolase superfamily enzyme